MNKNIGIILGIVALIIIIVFFLFDSSKRDMIIGKWYNPENPEDIVEFHDNNDVTAPTFEDAIWTLSDDEGIIEIHFISDKLRESMLLELVSISEEKLCFIEKGWDEIYHDNIITDITDQERTECLSRISD